MKPFLLIPDANNRQTFARPAPDYVDARVLAANVSESHTIPAGAAFCIFSSDGNFYAKQNGAAAVPAADVTNGSGSELNPTIWNLDGVTSIGLISSSVRIVTLTFYKATN